MLAYPEGDLVLYANADAAKASAAHYQSVSERPWGVVEVTERTWGMPRIKMRDVCK